MREESWIRISDLICDNCDGLSANVLDSCSLTGNGTIWNGQTTVSAQVEEMVNYLKLDR